MLTAQQAITAILVYMTAIRSVTQDISAFPVPTKKINLVLSAQLASTAWRELKCQLPAQMENTLLEEPLLKIIALIVCQDTIA